MVFFSSDCNTFASILNTPPMIFFVSSSLQLARDHIRLTGVAHKCDTADSG